MKILVTGSTGLVGTAVVSELSGVGHDVFRLVRSAPDGDREIAWDPDKETIDRKSLEGFDAVVHLAGENIASGRWTDEQKRKIRESRIKGTSLLVDALQQLSTPPRVLVSASASGYYGNRGNEILPEESPAGTGFLPEVCTEWESEARKAEAKGIRTVQTRFGIILSPKGGALQKMLTPFKMGVGGRMGSGEQYWSWLALEDAAGIIRHVIETESFQGPVNATTPSPVTNAQFTKMLAGVLHRPAIFPMPAVAARLALGEMADELLLSSTRMLPSKLIASNYLFRYPDLDGALRALLD